jgi:hypothetical protein
MTIISVMFWVHSVRKSELVYEIKIIIKQGLNVFFTNISCHLMFFNVSGLRLTKK